MPSAGDLKDKLESPNSLLLRELTPNGSDTVQTISNRNEAQLNAWAYCRQASFRLDSLDGHSQTSAANDTHSRHQNPMYSTMALAPPRSSLVQYQTD